MVSVSPTSFNIVGRSMLDVFYGVGCCLIKFEFACPQTFSPRQRAPVFSFKHLHPKPVALEHNIFPCGFLFPYVSSTICKEKSMVCVQARFA